MSFRKDWVSVVLCVLWTGSVANAQTSEPQELNSWQDITRRGEGFVFCDMATTTSARYQSAWSGESGFVRRIYYSEVFPTSRKPADLDKAVEQNTAYTDLINAFRSTMNVGAAFATHITTIMPPGHLLRTKPQCYWLASREDAVAWRERWLAGIGDGGNDKVAVPFDYSALTPVASQRTVQAGGPTSGITVVTEDPATVRERERIAEAARIEAERADLAVKRQQAMDLAVQARMRAHVVALQQQSRQRVAELKRKREACRAGDKSACRIDLQKSGASKQ